MIIALQILLVLAAVVFLARAINTVVLMKWFAHPQSPGSTTIIEGRRMFYTMKGEGRPIVVIEAALGSSSAEWWAVQDSLAERTRVITYDRAGYGWSEIVPGARTSQRVASELKLLLEDLEIEEPLLMVGHSLGGLYVNHFCRLFPNLVAGVVLIDPMSPDIHRFNQELAPHIVARSGLNKRRALKMQAFRTGFGLPRLMKRVMFKSESLRPYRKLAPAAFDAFWHNLLMIQTPQNALNEYLQANLALNAVGLKNSGAFPAVPLRVLTHSSEKVIHAMVRTGRLTEDDVRKFEELSQELIRAHCSLSPRSKLIVAEQSGTIIHLEQPELVIQSILDVVLEVRQLPGFAA